MNIKKEQLLSEKSFIRYCREDNPNHHISSKLNVDDKFLDAAKQDGFIKPLLKQKETIKEGGKEVTKTVNYYSPHQQFIIAKLSKNKVSKHGKLWNDDDLEHIKFFEEKNARMVAWGWYGAAYEINHYKKAKKSEKDNPLNFCNDFHQLLKLIHSLNPLAHYELGDGQGRLYRNTPSTFYSLKPVRDGGIGLLSEFKLNIKKLNTLRKSVGEFAIAIDPLEHWYYYVKRHPYTKKDILKGNAGLAQEFYLLYDLITKIIEIVTEEKSEPLFELLYKDTPLIGSENIRIEYLKGSDIKALKYSFQQLKIWMKKKGNSKFVRKEIIDALPKIKETLNDFEDRYGDRSEVSNGLVYRDAENIKYESLDEYTKKIVDNFQKQSDNPKNELSDSIALAISCKLGDMKRDMRDILMDVADKIYDNVRQTWDEKKSYEERVWFRPEIQKMPPIERRKHIKKEVSKFDKRAWKWKEKHSEYCSQVSRFSELVFCKNCRKKPIQLHNDHLEYKVSEAAICDSCIKEIKPDNISKAPLKCEYCGNTIYKFAHGNILNDVLVNKCRATIKLEYGRMAIEVRCKRCRKSQIQKIDWGWLP